QDGTSSARSASVRGIGVAGRPVLMFGLLDRLESTSVDQDYELNFRETTLDKDVQVFLGVTGLSK
ncbi:hypothetical protein, partial [Pseudomonas asuensis]|uniref:hypothetical protein n=1 Tax=Pseudomonas asuensis TaxID=1825787 RepID=UPI001E318400